MPFERIRLSEIAESVDYGVTASAATEPIGPKFLRITDIQGGSVNWNAVPWCEAAEREASAAHLNAGDIVFARTGATTGKSFLVRHCPESAVFASYLIRVRLSKVADPVYVSHFFQTPDYWAQISRSAKGVAQPGVNASTLKTLELPLPPLPEQRRIAAILDQADALRAKRREALGLLDGLAQAVFVEMFGDPASNPLRWRIGCIADLLESASYGTSEKSAASGAFPVLRMNNLTRSGDLDLSDLKYMDLPDALHGRYLVRSGDVLFNRTNSAELVGKTAMVPAGTRPLAYAGYLIRLRVNAENDSTYLSRFLNTTYAKKLLRSMCKSIIGMANINATEIQAMAVAIPPLKLQRDFASRIQAIESLKITHRAALAESDALFASLQHRAFTGQLS
jgi:type I restriction enzyme, S subunit